MAEYCMYTAKNSVSPYFGLSQIERTTLFSFEWVLNIGLEEIRSWRRLETPRTDTIPNKEIYLRRHDDGGRLVGDVPESLYKKTTPSSTAKVNRHFYPICWHIAGHSRF